ncbi:uncharacterized protein LOC106153670 isoform X2 [Lingula anatina]|uniref:Uncharacterized protein LOC106153670 isoform X1 n=1 Tax=Lingula anatina TaxID=7574 RepID=A0A1S3HCB7_LINAN|nr:uncharacterized protein LOC106153670 isoform X1 [Lingula anatina]XP_013383164.1 uncharacterized protein LOC106153670 isoform X2 [Lingula anatina]|eukprot:XP_013383156.1 uncharacterized protein LOC106153670 isoform X1 [Lingula anatina]
MAVSLSESFSSYDGEEDAIIRIQAFLRGTLTRKSLQEVQKEYESIVAEVEDDDNRTHVDWKCHHLCLPLVHREGKGRCVRPPTLTRLSHDNTNNMESHLLVKTPEKTAQARCSQGQNVDPSGGRNGTGETENFHVKSDKKDRECFREDNRSQLSKLGIQVESESSPNTLTLHGNSEGSYHSPDDIPEHPFEDDTVSGGESQGHLEPLVCDILASPSADSEDSDTDPALQNRSLHRSNPGNPGNNEAFPQDTDISVTVPPNTGQEAYTTGENDMDVSDAEKHETENCREIGAKVSKDLGNTSNGSPFKKDKIHAAKGQTKLKDQELSGTKLSPTFQTNGAVIPPASPFPVREETADQSRQAYQLNSQSPSGLHPGRRSKGPHDSSVVSEMTSVWDTMLSMEEAALVSTEYPRDVKSLQELRSNVAMELLWVQQAIESRKNYLRLKTKMQDQSS